MANFCHHSTDKGVQDFSGAYIPNKYLRLLRDVIAPVVPSEEEEAEPAPEEGEEPRVPQVPCPYTSLRFKVRFVC